MGITPRRRRPAGPTTRPGVVWVRLRGDSLEDFLLDFPSVSREHAIAVLEAAKAALLDKNTAA